MMKRAGMALLLVAASGGAMAATPEGFELHGYFRVGAGSNSEGGDQVCFRLPGAASKYRLGNECEGYGSLTVAQTFAPADDGAQYRVAVQFAYNTPAEQDWEDYDTALREIYAEGKGLLGGSLFKDARFWVGKRLRRTDVHMTDYFYWDNSGSGGGIEDVTAGAGKLSYAYMHWVDGRDEFGNPTTVKDHAITSHDLRWYDLPVNENGTLALGLDLRRSDESRSGFDGQHGYMVHVVHKQGRLWGGSNTLALQYGAGAGATLSRDADDTLGSDARSWRVVEQIHVEPHADWSGQATLVYERKQDRQTWWSFGVRPIYHVTDHFNVALELGHDRVRPYSGAERTLTKLTLAPQLAKGRGYYSRPVLRLFVTYAVWNEAAMAADGAKVLAGGSSGPFAADTSGLTYGVQAEAWW